MASPEPDLVAQCHKKHFKDMTLRELREEELYWQQQLESRKEWGASVGAAYEFLGEARKWIARKTPIDQPLKFHKPATDKVLKELDRIWAARNAQVLQKDTGESLQAPLSSFQFPKHFTSQYLLTLPNGTYLCTIVAYNIAEAEKIAKTYRQTRCVFETRLWLATRPYPITCPITHL
jgi:hypothetical protein